MLPQRAQKRDVIAVIAVLLVCCFAIIKFSQIKESKASELAVVTGAKKEMVSCDFTNDFSNSETLHATKLLNHIMLKMSVQYFNLSFYGDMSIRDHSPHQLRPRLLERECNVFSFGIDYNFSFEISIRKSFPKCRIISFDPSMERNQTVVPDGVVFLPFGLADRNYIRKDTGWHLKEIASLRRHAQKLIDYQFNFGSIALKIDIEGYEFDFMKYIVENPTELRYYNQIAFEIHAISEPLAEFYDFINLLAASGDWVIASIYIWQNDCFLFTVTNKNASFSS